MLRITGGILAFSLCFVIVSASPDQTPKIPSSTVERKVTKLTSEIHWLSSLKEAKEQAAKENKPILWLHALGDLDGVT